MGTSKFQSIWGILFFVSACGPAQTSSVTLLANKAADEIPLKNGTAYTISAKRADASGEALCVDVQQQSQNNGALLQIASCAGTASQTFVRRGSALQVYSNKCLDVIDGKLYDGARVQIWDCADNSPHQSWIARGKLLQYKGSNFCLDVTDGQFKQGAILQLWNCDVANSHQQFSMVPKIASNSPTTPASGQSGRTLVWNDEFTGNAIDQSKWNYEVNCDGGGNNEHQCYTSDGKNSWVQGGMLHIKVIKEKYANKDYTSARLTTAGKGDWTYGRFETRLKVPCGQGFWPAAWAMPTDGVYGIWPQSGELDIMEVLGGSPDTLHGTAHFGALAPNNRSKGGLFNLSQGTFCDDFHVFAIERYEDRVTWSVDGQDYFTLRPGDADFAPAWPWPFNKRFFFILNVAMGGNWPGNPDPSIQSGEMLVDYVRIYAPK